KCNAGYAGTNGVCTACNGGTFSPVRGLTACLSCTSGTNFSSTVGATTCTACNTTCPAGSYKSGTFGNATGLTKCYDCTQGVNYANNIGSTECKSCSTTPCPTNNVKNANCQVNADRTCKSCPTFSYVASDNCVCNDGYGGDANTGQCTICDAGKFSNSTYTTCEACPTDAYSAQGSGSCSPCRSTQACNSNEISSNTCDQTTGRYCTTCRIDKTALNNVCVCKPGYYYNSSSSLECIACPAGQYQDVANMTTCKACPDGSFSMESGRSTCTTCTKCAAGTYFKANCTSTADVQCDNCAAGNSSHYGAMKQSDCFMCPPGTISTSAGQTCSPCATGTYNPFYGQTAC
ncbi:hypothetical protein GUITHDRAFT_54881, partial [Guillardia theta CCMP2712]